MLSIPKCVIFILIYLHHSCIRGEEANSKCGSTLNLTNCYSNDIPLLSRRVLNKFKTLYVKGTLCLIREYHFQWKFLLKNGTALNFDHYKYWDTFHIEPFSITSGTHSVTVFVHEIYENNLRGSCHFVIEPENPVPIILGGSQRTVQAGKSFSLDGGNSIDLEVPTNQKGNLRYIWMCRVQGSTRGTDENFCLDHIPIEYSAVLVVPAEYALENLVYEFELEVKTEDSPWEKTHQIVHVKKNVEALSIKCLQNCAPNVLKTNVKYPLVLQAISKNNRNYSYVWSIDKPGFNYGTLTKHGRNEETFHLLKGALEPSKTYEIKVELGLHMGLACVKIVTHKPLELKSCHVIPPAGRALETAFSAECFTPEGQYVFEIYSVIKKREILLEKGPKLADISFVLPFNSKVKLKVIDKYEISSAMILSVTVTESLDYNLPKDELQKHISRIFFDPRSEKSFPELLRLKKFDKLVQHASVFAEELKSLPCKDDLHDFKMKLFNTLNQIPLDSRARAIQVTGLAKEVAAQTVAKQDPSLADEAARLCRNSAAKELELIERERFKESLTDEIIEDVKVLSECSQVGLNPNLELLEIPVIPYPTTPVPLLDFPVVNESYPDYRDDENVSSAVSKLESYVDNMVDLCFLNARILLETILPHEHNIMIVKKNFIVVAYKISCKHVPTIPVDLHKLHLLPSKDLSPGKANTLLCSSMKNPRWWQVDEKIIPPVCMLKFNEEGKTVNRFSRPFTLIIERNEFESILSINGTVPKILNGINEDFERMTIYRIDVFKGEDYFVEFSELGSNKLKVYVTKFYKPTIDEFDKKSSEINANSSKLFIEVHENYDRWDYLTIMPFDKVASVDTKFKFKVYTIACHSWNSNKRKWEFSCDSSNTSTVTKIECLCYKSSVLSARVTNNAVRMEHSVYTEHKLEIQACYVIFLTVLIVWFVYCALFLYILLSRRGQAESSEEIYFLSDVPNYCKFGYLMVIKTSDKRNAGTTSNIVIKIYGSLSNSKEHVLNYPDPYRLLLQRNSENWFFFATEHHLGDIEKIEIWFDSVGCKPSWHCMELEILDLQTRTYWRFWINRKFEIKDVENYFHTAVPSKATKSGFFENISCSLHGRHKWKIWKEYPLLNKIARLTLMLSIFYTNFAIMLMLYSIPLFMPSDSLSAFSQYGFYWKIIWTTVLGFAITFLLHYPLEYHLKRNYRKNICWILLIFLITVALLLSLILGFWVPYITSLLWLTSSIASLLVYIFLLENLVLIYENLTKQQKDRIRYLLESVSLRSLENQREKLYKAFGKYSMRPYFEHLYKPLDIDDVEEIKYHALMKEKLHYIFEDIIMIVMYILLLYLLIFLHKDPVISISNEEMNSLIAGEHSRTHFDSFQGKYGILDYIENTLIISLQSPVWYGKFTSKDPGMTVDNSNKYVGRARLRQHRSGKSSCPEILRDFVCISHFSDRPIYQRFSESWQNDSESDKFARMDSAWKYQDAGTSSYIGEIDSYPGGGYVLPLGRTLKNSLTNFHYLKRHRWFDRCTRSLFVEFLTYTANANILNSVTVAFEVSLTGYVRMKRDIITARLLLVGESKALLWLVSIPFLIIVVILALKLIWNVVKNKLIWLKDAWCLMDASIILMTVSCAVLYAMRSTYLGEFLDEIEKAERNVFVNYFHLFHMERLLTVTSALLVFLATFRLWKLLRFMYIIRVVEKTLSLSRFYLICVFICHFHLIIVFTIAGFLLFGDDSENFNRLMDSFVSLILSSIGFFSFDFDAFQSPLHYFYLIAFVLSTMLISTVYVAIISISFAESKNFYSNYQEYNVVDFIKEHIVYYKESVMVKWKKLRLKGGEDATETKPFVYPKSDEERYADSLRIDRIRMERMRQLAKNVLRNTRIRETRMNEDDVQLINETVAALRRQDEKGLVFFVDKTAGRTRFVDNQTLLGIEKSLNDAYYKKSIGDSCRDEANERIDAILRGIEVVRKGLEYIVFD